jgi:hypothetical protein
VTVYIEIRWPLGETERMNGIGVDHLVHVTEGLGMTRLQKLG